MRNILYPEAYRESIYDIPFHILKKKGIKGVIFDVDNTLGSYSEKEPCEMVVSLIRKLRRAGFSVCLLSNNSKGRIRRFNRKLQVHAVHRAAKPLTVGISKALRLMRCDSSQAVLIGDQIFTDVICGNLSGVKPILVNPCSYNEILLVKLKRIPEQIILKRYLKTYGK